MNTLVDYTEVEIEMSKPITEMLLNLGGLCQFLMAVQLRIFLK